MRLLRVIETCQSAILLLLLVMLTSERSKCTKEGLCVLCRQKAYYLLAAQWFDSLVCQKLPAA